MAPFKSTTSRSSKEPISSAASQHHEPAEHSFMDDFSARRSGRVATTQCVPDNDTWVEALAVCEMAKDPKKTNKNAKSGGLLKKLKSKSNAGSSEITNTNIQQQHEAEMAMAAQRLALRPYFQSRNTGQRVWDEPPSGASNIIYATTESRKMAQAQLEEMRATYAHASLVRKSERETSTAVENSFADQKSSRKISLPKIFKRSSTTEEGRSQMSTPLVAAPNTDSARTGIPESVLEESITLASESAFDQELQMAMMLSMGVGEGSVMGVGDHATKHNYAGSLSVDNCTPAAAARREKEAIEMAKALSIAEEKARCAPIDEPRKNDKQKKKHGLSEYTSLKNDETSLKSDQAVKGPNNIISERDQALVKRPHQRT